MLNPYVIYYSIISSFYYLMIVPFSQIIYTLVLSFASFYTFDRFMLIMPTPVVTPDTFTRTFISQVDPPEFDNRSSHPIIRYIKGDIAFCERRKLKSFSLYQIGNSFPFTSPSLPLTPFVTQRKTRLSSQALSVLFGRRRSRSPLMPKQRLQMHMY